MHYIYQKVGLIHALIHTSNNIAAVHHPYALTLLQTRDEVMTIFHTQYIQRGWSLVEWETP